MNGIFVSNFQTKADLFNDFFVEQCSIYDNGSTLPASYCPRRRLQSASEEESSPPRMRVESFRGYGQRDREKNFPGRNRQASLPGMSGEQTMASWFVIRPSPPAVSHVVNRFLLTVCQVEYKSS